MYVGIGVGLFVLFASIAIWAFWRHSRKRKRAINHQTQYAAQQRAGQQMTTQQTSAQQQWPRHGVEADGLAYRTELEAQSKPEQYREMNAHRWESRYQGGHVVEAQSTRDPQEMPLTFGQHPPQEMPGNTQSDAVGRRWA